MRLGFLWQDGGCGIGWMKSEIPDRRALILAIFVARPHLPRFEGRRTTDMGYSTRPARSDIPTPAEGGAAAAVMLSGQGNAWRSANELYG